ncbi:hypothetical protein GPECTOR_65g218 [Gonium pectorale]|uniref:DAGKc domain-containing protein n=1 Tax=Gonium pectorale TaxID=33097 RepID=A0A150G5J9_GONPE|nr:hypothetical protein GPECTOR_65g218 [Gonium pectorale]|eukprot:KXZ44600.1 hypothetical protein GPECTOR_65g218 [Gonium pectorale]
MKSEELGSYQGLVAVGGDGMFQELVSGILARRARGDPAAHRIRLGHIPAGSTDAVACTLHGSRCAVTSALHIALGDRLALDCGRVAAAGGEGEGGAASVRHFVCLAGYGFMGEVMRHSERLRWLGPGRSDKSKRGIIPNGHLSDGRMYLVLVSAVRHHHFLRFLLRLASRGLVDRCTPHVRVIPITAMRLSPLPGGHSVGGCLWDAAAPASAWNVDGELLYDCDVEIAVQRGAVEVFARGPETGPTGAQAGGRGNSSGAAGRR